MVEIREIKSIEDYNEFINSENTLNVLKVGANWCTPCRLIMETLRGLNEDEVSGVLLADVNVDDEWFEDKADELRIRGIPVLIAFKNGEEKERAAGLMQKPAIIDFFGRNK